MAEEKLSVERIEQIQAWGGIFLWDSSALCAKGFQNCVKDIFQIFRNPGNSFYVPEFALGELAGPEGVGARMVIERNLLKKVPGVKNYAELFRFAKAKQWTKLNLILCDARKMADIRNAAKEEGLNLYIYRLGDEGGLESWRVDRDPAGRSGGFRGEAGGTGTGAGIRRAGSFSQAAGRAGAGAGGAQQSAGRAGTGEGTARTGSAQGGTGRTGNGDGTGAPSSMYRRDDRRPSGFSIQTQPERVPFVPIRVDRELNTGDTVTDAQGRRYVLGELQVTNTDARTFATDTPGIWVKIYQAPALNTYTEAKIGRMLTQRMDRRGLCWPKAVVRDEAGRFRGCTMDEFRGAPLHLCIFKRAGIETYFPGWTKADLCELTQTILDMVDFLHRRNVLFGCINPAAIRVKDKNEVYFTETDNYQIDGFPCMVHNISFTAPELLDKKIYLATRENENFAVAELVFMLMMPGKTPYAVGGLEAPEKLIREMKFPFASGRVQGKQAMPGMWRFMWSHLGSLRGCFYNVFQKGAKYNSPADRQGAYYWKKAVGYYQEELKNPEDPESLKIYPSSFRRRKNETFYRCNFCGVEHPEFYFYREYFQTYRICNSCINKPSKVSFTCQACGKTYYYTNRTALFHQMMKTKDADWKDQKYCSDCKKKTVPCKVCGKEVPYFYIREGRCPDCGQKYRNSVYSRVVCKDCGKTFEITVNDHEFYQKKGMSDPVRCKECREKRKNGNYPGGGSGRGGYGGGNSYGSGSGSGYGGRNGSGNGSGYGGRSGSGNGSGSTGSSGTGNGNSGGNGKGSNSGGKRWGGLFGGWF